MRMTKWFSLIQSRFARRTCPKRWSESRRRLWPVSAATEILEDRSLLSVATALSFRSGSQADSAVIGSISAGQTAFLRADAIGMSGRTVAVEVWEDDGAVGDDRIASFQVTINGSGFGTVPWVATWQGDDEDDPFNRYYLFYDVPLSLADLYSGQADTGHFIVAGPTIEGSAYRLGVVPTPVVLSRLLFDGPTEKNINKDLETWVIIHGRDNSASTPSIQRLAAAVHTAQPAAQVLTLDWHFAAAAVLDELVSLGEGWIEPVGQWAAAALKDYGFTTDKLNLIGHSWGSYVADELAEAFPGGVNTIVGLDPAANTTGSNYNVNDPGEINFAAHSKFSWAFHSSNILGNEVTPTSADEAFVVDMNLFLDPLGDHVNIRELFAYMISNPGGVSDYFSLNRLKNHVLGLWKKDQFNENGYAGGNYEASIEAIPNASVPDSISYFSAATNDAGTNDRVTISETTKLHLVASGLPPVPEGFSRSFTVKLSDPPPSDVVVNITREGDADLNASPTTLTFTAGNWNTNQFVTVSAAQDADNTNGSATFNLTASGLPSRSLTATELDDEAIAATADLQGLGLFVTQNSAQWGQTINVDTAVIKNAGTGASGAFQVEWYLSRDAIGSADDIRLMRTDGSSSYRQTGIGAGANGGNFNVALQLPINLPTGWSGTSFYVVMKTDSANQVAESNENNNFGQIGNLYDSDALTVTARQLFPKITVKLGPTTIINGQTTPIGFGTVEGSNTGLEILFTVQNDGGATLNLKLPPNKLPSGFLLTDPLQQSLEPGRADSFKLKLDPNAAPGLKSGNVSIEMDGGSFQFAIEGRIEPPTPAEITVLLDSTELVSGNTTPIDIGTAVLGQTPPKKTFRIQNDGRSPLTFGEIVVPAGFRKAGPDITSLDPGAWTPLTIEVDPWSTGLQLAEIRIPNSDGDESSFTFLVRGMGQPVPDNRPPVVVPIPDQTITEGTKLTFPVIATDENDMVFYVLSGPPGARIEGGTNIFRWVPTETQGGATYTITIVVNDNGRPNMKSTLSFKVTVLDKPIEEVRVNTDASGRQHTVLDPSDPGTSQAVAMDANGNSVVTWTSLAEIPNQPNFYDWEHGRIYARRYNASGASQGSEFQVSTATTYSRGGAVAANDGGDFMIVWIGNGPDGLHLNVYGRRYDSRGAAQSDEFRISTTDLNTNTAPRVAMAADGRSVVVWERQGIRARMFDASGRPVGDELRIDSGGGGRRPSVAMAADGKFAVAWEQGGIQARLFDATGKPVGTEFQVGTNEGTAQEFPSVAMDYWGNLVVAWRRDYPDVPRMREIYAQRFGSSGIAQGPEFRVNSTTIDDQQEPSVSMGPGGSFLIIWTSPQDVNDTEVYAQRFGATGEKVGTEFRANSTVSKFQRRASAAIDSRGHAAIVWSGNGPGDSDGVFMRTFSNPELSDLELPPIIGSLIATPDPVTRSSPLTIEASSLIGSVGRVEFYRDADGDQAGAASEFLGMDSNGTDGWQLTALTGGWPLGQITLLARAVGGQQSLTSAWQSTVVTITQPPAPDIVMDSVTANGKTTLTVQYQILNMAVTGPLNLQFLQSSDTRADSADTVLSTVTISNATDLAVGSHSLTFTIGSQVLLPGAGKSDDGSDYFILAVADPANAITENDVDPLNDNNTASFVGAYATTSTIYLHGSIAADMVTLTYPATKAGNVALGLSGSISATYSYAYNSTAQFRVRTHDGNDLVNMVNSSNLAARPTLQLGGNGDDVLNGAAGADTLNGGAGNDTLRGDKGNDSLDGGSGTNTLVESADVNFTLTNALLTGVGTDTLVNLQVANLTGGTSSNTFTVNGWSGAGSLVGGGSADTIVASKNVSFTLSNAGLQTTDGMNLSLNGFTKATLTGAAGDNTFIVGDWTGTCTLSGGNGTDTLSVTRNANMTLTNTALTAASYGTLTLSGLEVAALTGGVGDNSFTVSGWNGTGTLTGGGGTDTVVAIRNANFTLSDTQLVASNGLTMTLAELHAANLTGGASNNTLTADGFTLGNVTLSGGAGNDSLVGGSGDDSLDGGNGNDSLVGNAGNDMLNGGAGNGDLVIAAGATTFVLSNTALSGVGTDSLMQIELARLTTANTNSSIDARQFSGQTTLTGGNGNDTIWGGHVADSILGGDGDDVLLGGDGNDSILGGADNDIILGGAGDDSLSGSNSLAANNATADGADTIMGGTGKDRLFGGLGNDILSGEEGNDTLSGDGGTDSLFGGAGADSPTSAAAPDVFSQDGVFSDAAFTANLTALLAAFP